MANIGSPPWQLADLDLARERPIGRGANSQVFLYTARQAGVQLAVKRIARATITNPQRVLDEKSILMSIAHPAIVRLFCTMKDDAYLYLAMEWCSGGCITNQIERSGSGIPLESLRVYAYELLSAIRYLHTTAGVLHRDIKPGNLLLTNDGHLKLCDFGLSKRIVADARCTTLCGTEIYWAPEMVRRHRDLSAEGAPFDDRVDIWAFGVTIYQMAFSEHPFQDASAEGVFNKILRGDLMFPEQCDATLEGFLRSAMTVDQHDRPTACELASHEFLKGLDDSVFRRRGPPFAHPDDTDDDEDAIDDADQAAFDDF
ncbi:Protein kinase domain-containing protein [Plasmodiophora brassicae]|uniref:Protein kinase domain-containing protein n=2 Tax=Plasmodiophora brassicae TaxID=37360 RepID=A0A3P3YAH8_PLABS|nr:unnamed protein product [Plasmodiophora brassicae]